MKRIAIWIAGCVALLTMSNASACDLTISSGQNVQTALNTSGVTTVCLNAGTYTLSTTITVPDGKTLRGLGTTRDDVVISSSATRVFDVGNSTTLHNFAIQGQSLPEYGVLAYQKTGVDIWGLRIHGVVIGVGVNGSNTVAISDVFFKFNGNLTNGIADPNIWITHSHYVNVNYGELFGRNNGPGGDGELACYHSSNVHVLGTQNVESGASAFYLVNCDSSSIKNTVIHRAGEWGLDIQFGSDYFVAENNTVKWSYFGGGAFDERFNLGGQYVNNTFEDNNSSGVGSCNGVNVVGNVSSPSFSGNSATPAGVSCTFNVTWRVDENATHAIYTGLVLRVPDKQGWVYWLHQVQEARCTSNSSTLHAMLDTVVFQFVAGAEHQALGLSNQQFVTALYNAVFRRIPDSGGLAYWTNELNTNARTREQVRSAFVNSSEFSTNTVGPIMSQTCLDS